MINIREVLLLYVEIQSNKPATHLDSWLNEFLEILS